MSSRRGRGKPKQEEEDEGEDEEQDEEEDGVRLCVFRVVPSHRVLPFFRIHSFDHAHL